MSGSVRGYTKCMTTLWLKLYVTIQGHVFELLNSFLYVRRIFILNIQIVKYSTHWDCMQPLCFIHANSRSQLKVDNLNIWFHVCIMFLLNLLTKMVSSMRRWTEYMSPLYGLKVSVITSCQALYDIHLTLITYWPKLRRMRRTHVHGRSLTSYGANDFCSQQPKTCRVALPFYFLLNSILVMLW